MKENLAKILSVLAGLCLLTGILLSVIDGICFQRGFYHYEFKKENQAKVIGMPEDDLMKATDTLLDFLQDKRDDIVVSATIDGYERDVFNTRETLHMDDVKDLYQNVLKARSILLFIGAVLLLSVYLLCRDRQLEVIWDAFVNGSILIGMFVVLILIWILFDFSDFWMDFYYLLFDNDLFLLDPSSSIMINMFPASFFSDMVLLIIVSYIAILGVIYFILRFLKKKKVDCYDSCCTF